LPPQGQFGCGQSTGSGAFVSPAFDTFKSCQSVYPLIGDRPVARQFAHILKRLQYRADAFEALRSGVKLAVRLDADCRAISAASRTIDPPFGMSAAHPLPVPA